MQQAADANVISEVAELRKVLAALPALNTPPLMIQVGASEGNFARSFAEKGWLVHAFDAAPTYETSGPVPSPSGRYHFHNTAIALDERETVTFYVNRRHPTVSSLKRFHPDHEPVDVPATTLRRFYDEHQITAIDFFMIDAELMDLEIMKTHDWSIPIGALMMECMPRNVLEIYREISARWPSYRHMVFEWRKPVAGAGIMGKCERIVSADEHADATLDGTVFGNILFFDRSTRRPW